MYLNVSRSRLVRHRSHTERQYAGCRVVQQTEMGLQTASAIPAVCAGVIVDSKVGTENGSKLIGIMMLKSDDKETKRTLTKTARS